MNTHKKDHVFVLGAIAGLFLCIPLLTWAFTTYSPGDSITIGEFVYDDDMVATTTDCVVNVYSPSGTAVIQNTAMAAQANGWHSYSFTASSTTGVWPSTMSCGSALRGDLVHVDKTFAIQADSSVSTSSIASAVWNSSTRTITAFGSLAADIWNDSFSGIRRLTDKILGGGGSLATETYVDTATSTIATSVSSGDAALQASITNASSSIVAGVNAHGSSLANQTQNAISSASSSIVAGVNAQSSSLASDTQNAITAAITTASTSIAAGINAQSATLAAQTQAAIANASTSLGAAISSQSGSTLITSASTSLAALIAAQNAQTQALIQSASSSVVSSINTTALSIAADTQGSISNASSSIVSLVNSNSASLAAQTQSFTQTAIDTASTSIASSINNRSTLLAQQGGWKVLMSDFGAVHTGSTYRVKVTTINSESKLATPYATPRITVYDANRNAVATNISMTQLSTGIYEYTYSVASAAAEGVWETVASTEVENGSTISTNDYWEVQGSPAQVIIRSITNATVPNVTASVTITNEGSTGYEYQYEWCVVSTDGNQCGGGDDLSYGMAAKFINPGDDFDTILSGTVPSAGNYFFKLKVYFGTDSSSASQSFTATSTTPVDSGGSGGGGGGSSRQPSTTCNGADLNKDKSVGSIDFSILLYFWKTNPPFANQCVDINQDKVVDSKDFSILLYQWGSKGTPFVKR